MLFRLLLSACLREDKKRAKYRWRNTWIEVSIENVANGPVRFDFLSLNVKNRNENLYTVGSLFCIQVAEVRLSAGNIMSRTNIIHARPLTLERLPLFIVSNKLNFWKIQISEQWISSYVIFTVNNNLTFRCLWLYSSLLGLGTFFSFLIFYTVGRTTSTGDQPVAKLLPTHRTTQTE
jgi:hypothetical protein